MNNPTINTSNNSLPTNITNDNSPITEISLKTSLSTTKSISLSSMNTTTTTATTTTTTTSILNNSQLIMMKKKSAKKNSTKLNDTLLNITDEQLVLQYLIKNENIMDYLKPGVPDRIVYEKLLKLDEMEVSNYLLMIRSIH
ncbi:unnamed protein product [Schistosoma margrebowiei]|uniref:Uncharacterized protein n=1 Tax=Schistosoma margrebowiei TaxID=48269 RepID=A0A183N6X1_9TREM|nr:unnamed protein product [Schistosoma margrebowiei]